MKYFLVVHIWVINTNFLAEIRSSYETRGIELDKELISRDICAIKASLKEKPISIFIATRTHRSKIWGRNTMYVVRRWCVTGP